MLHRMASTFARRASALSISLAIAVFGAGLQAHGADMAPTSAAQDQAPDRVLQHDEAVVHGRVELPAGHDHVANDCLVLVIALVALPFGVDAPDVASDPVSVPLRGSSQSERGPTPRPPR